MDYAYEQTENSLAELEDKIRKIYSTASEQLQEKIITYFERLTERDEHQRKLLEAGQITKEQYQLWRLAQIGRGERYIALQNEIARRCNEANMTAVAYINDTTPGIYSLNYNYSAYTIEKTHGNVGFTLFDEQTVRRLLVEDPELLPAPRVDIPADLKWNRQKLQRELVSGIMQGESIGKLADRFQSITDMNRVSALRNARTAVTGAQNAGRQESYDRAAAMGIRKRKCWRAVKDGRTRHSHGMLDGKIVDAEDFFVSELGSRLLYPGDRDHGAEPADLYNCRCGMQLVEEDGIEAEPRMMRVRNPVTGRNELISEMTYQEWYDWKRSQDPAAFDTALKKTTNAVADRKQHEKYRSLLGNKVPKTFADFQDMKYNDLDRWSMLKYQYRTANQYKVDAGNVSVDDILKLDEKLISEKRDNFSSKYKYSGNIAGAFINGDEFYLAHSRIDAVADMKAYKGTEKIVGLKEARRYTYIDVAQKNGKARTDTFYDTEAKLFEAFADLYEIAPFKTVTMISERGMCDSCKGVMHQFMQTHPDVTVNVISNKKVESNVWKHRRRKK